MYPILFKIPNVSTMAGEILVVEVVVGAVCLLCWIALKLRNSTGVAITIFSTGAMSLQGDSPSRSTRTFWFTRSYVQAGMDSDATGEAPVGSAEPDPAAGA